MKSVESGATRPKDCDPGQRAGDRVSVWRYLRWNERPGPVEDDDIPALDIANFEHGPVDQDPITNLERVLHGAGRDGEGLDQERGDEKDNSQGNGNRYRDVPPRLPTAIGQCQFSEVVGAASSDGAASSVDTAPSVDTGPSMGAGSSSGAASVSALQWRPLPVSFYDAHGSSRPYRANHAGNRAWRDHRG